LIVVHEFGHFIVAKRSGVGVLKFSVGFGPNLFARTVNGTEYAVSAIPLGGYVKMIGEDPEAEEPVDPKISFSHQPIWKRAAIVTAGPVFNLIFAFVAFSAVFYAYGARIPSEAAKVGGAMDGRPASRAMYPECLLAPSSDVVSLDASLREGDVVSSVDGRRIETWEELSEAIQGSGGREVELVVLRDGSPLTLLVRPEAEPNQNLFGEVTGEVYRIGIERGFDQEQVGVARAITMGASQTAWWVQTLALSVVKIFQGRIPARDIGGPILIVQTAGQQAKVGLESLLHFMAVISINLGILNLLPIPILDGGHLLFLTIEAVMRRPLDTRHREIAQQVGFVILICLMAFAFYNDIARNLPGWG